MFEEVEGALYRLEDLNEMLDLQSRQLDHRFQLALYKEKKLIELNDFKGTLCCNVKHLVYIRLFFIIKFKLFFSFSKAW